MQDLKIALVQANQVWEDKTANLSHFAALLQSTEAVDLILLPEMFQTGFSMNAASLAEKMEDSTSIKWLKQLTAEKQAAVYTSLIIEEDGLYYNRGVFVEPTGQLTIYDKRKTFGLAGEDKVYTAGSSAQIVHFKNWRIQLQICYDLRFPEIVRNQITSNHLPAYDVILYVANWPERRSEHWKSLLKARAIENQSYVVGVNRVGEDANKLKYSGDSMLIDALGNVNYCTSSEEEVKIVTIKMETLTEIRELLPFLKDR
jgi:predicted amidohydrolase